MEDPYLRANMCHFFFNSSSKGATPEEQRHFAPPPEAYFHRCRSVRQASNRRKLHLKLLEAARLQAARAQHMSKSKQIARNFPNMLRGHQCRIRCSRDVDLTAGRGTCGGKELLAPLLPRAGERVPAFAAPLVALLKHVLTHQAASRDAWACRG